MGRIPIHERLARIAAPLQPVETPFWVSYPDETQGTPAQGWYWVPAGLERPSFLGASGTTAEIALLTHRGQLQRVVSS